MELFTNIVIIATLFHLDVMTENTWKDHNMSVSSKALQPAGTLMKALEKFELQNFMPSTAIDLGSGSGIDSLELLKSGWNVIAIDKEASSHELLLAELPPNYSNKIQTITSPFESAELSEVDLINATFSLPFCDKAYFSNFWDRVVDAIKPGGRFCGQLFGINDSWASHPSMTFHSSEQVDLLFHKFELELYLEKEYNAHTLAGVPKHWHVFHIVAQKK
jgi:tellurite methyltransferase